MGEDIVFVTLPMSVNLQESGAVRDDYFMFYGNE
jgi:hypothetical protein